MNIINERTVGVAVTYYHNDAAEKQSKQARWQTIAHTCQVDCK